MEEDKHIKKVIIGSLIAGVILAILLLPHVSAEDVTIDYYFKYAENVDLRRECFNDGAVCGPTFNCNISVYDPENRVLVNNVLMTNQISYYNYTIPKDNTSGFNLLPTGTYRNRMYCTDGTNNGAEIFFFEITTTGDDNNNVVFMFLIGISIVVFLLAVISKNSYIGFAAATLFIVTGVYTMIYGFSGIFDTYTRAVAFVIIGLGVLFLISASMSALSEQTN